MALAPDPYRNRVDHATDPAYHFANFAPSDANDVPIVPKGVAFGTTGNAVLVGRDGVSANVPVLAGVLYPYRPQRIKATGHTAGTVTLAY